MPSFRQFKYWCLVAGFPLLIGGVMLLGILKDCRSLPDAETQYRVQSDRGFDESIETAMGYINRAAECTILVKGSADAYDIRFIAMTDTPCNVDPLHTGIQTGHTANAYKCPNTAKWDIDVEKPGDIKLMVCVAAHEILHALGFADGNYGLMDPYSDCKGRVWLSDTETAKLKLLCD